MDSRKQQNELAGLCKEVAAYLSRHPERADEVFRFFDPELRERAEARIKSLSLHEVVRLHDRITYISRTRIVHQEHEAPRCRGKVIYSHRDAQAKANQIWERGRGLMRVYHCPLCKGHHLTHTELRQREAGLG